MNSKSPLSLAEFQQRFRHAIVSGGDDQDLEKELRHPERMEAYLDGYPVRFEDVLRDTFETVYALLSPEEGHQLSEAYARTFPSITYNINKVGKHMSEFLKNAFAPAVRFPYLSDLAKFEWVRAEAFHAALLPFLSKEELSAISSDQWAAAKFCFQPSLFVISSEYALFDIWKRKFDLIHKPTMLLIFRDGFDVRAAPVSPEEGMLIESLQEGKTLSEAVEMISGLSEEKVFEAFARWMQSGWIVAIKTL